MFLLTNPCIQQRKSWSHWSLTIFWHSTLEAGYISPIKVLRNSFWARFPGMFSQSSYQYWRKMLKYVMEKLLAQVSLKMHVTYPLCLGVFIWIVLLAKLCVNAGEFGGLNTDSCASNKRSLNGNKHDVQVVFLEMVWESSEGKRIRRTDLERTLWICSSQRRDTNLANVRP